MLKKDKENKCAEFEEHIVVKEYTFWDWFKPMGLFNGIKNMD